MVHMILTGVLVSACSWIAFAAEPSDPSEEWTGADLIHESVVVGPAIAVGQTVVDGQCVASGGCSNFGENYPPGVFSTNSSSFTTVSAFSWASDFTYYSVVAGCTYEWTLCAGDGASASYNSELSLWSQDETTLYCYSDNFCGDDAKIRWTSDFTGTVVLLISAYHCQGNSVNSTLRWRREGCAAPPLPDLTPHQPAHWNDKIPIGVTPLGWAEPHDYSGPYYNNQTVYFNWASLNQGTESASNYTVRIEVTGHGVGYAWGGFTTLAGTYSRLSTDQNIGPLSAGPHTFRLWLDYDSDVAESDESNNYYERTITVTAVPPDLTPFQLPQWDDKIPIGVTQLAGDANHNYSGLYYSNQTLYFNFASLNQGGLAASNYTIRVQVTGYGVSHAWGGFTTLPGTYFRLSTDQGIGPLSAGSHTFKLWLDYDSDVAESDELNNYYERTISVLGVGGDLLSAVARKSNPSGPGGVCDLPIDLVAGDSLITTDPRQDTGTGRGITQIVLTYSAPPTPLSPILQEDASCPSPPVFGSYTGTSVRNWSSAGNTLVGTFVPGLENARTYRLTVPHGAGTAYVELRGLIGDLDGNGVVNAVDRAVVVGAWTSPAGFTCGSDIDNSSATNAVDRAMVIGAWTGAGTNCAP